MNKLDKLKLRLDTESINQESEIHSNNFGMKIKSLAEHCVSYIYGYHNEKDCSNNKYNKDIHDFDLNNSNTVICNEVSKQKKFPFFHIKKLNCS